MKKIKLNHLILYLLFCFIYSSCDNKKQTDFEVIEHTSTGLNFINKLTSYPDFNMFKYMYFFNGAGVGAADFNNDGLIDLIFASNQGKNSLFINQGNLKFKDVTDQTNIPQDNAWSTGISVVDINGDGLMDIYISRVGNFGRLQSKNQFLICTEILNGIPKYVDKAQEMGLDFSAFGTQAAFLDYDMDGDLDMYMMNHSLRYNGTFLDKEKYDHTRNLLSGDRLLKNEGLKFTDVSEAAGIKGNIIGYGLGICIADINVDGLPDIYIGNDFHENDYMYMNNGDGTFTDKLTESIKQTSQFSMGVDIADITNDGLPEIITMDMLPSDPYLLRRSLGEDSYDLFNHKIRAGYHYQYARNTLQLNRGNNKFSEIGRYAGVHATDWSWSSLFMDFDNDGLKDLFVSNGIPKRMNDIDYIKFISDDLFQQKIKENAISEKELKQINKFPEIKLENVFLKNVGNSKFEHLKRNIQNDKKTFSNGAVYADFDNDGDLDIAVNNIDDYALIYENKSNLTSSNKYLKITLKGNEKNINALGAKVLVFSKNGISTYEKQNVRGFLSSMEIPIHVSFGSVLPDSIILVWPNNSYEKIAFDNQQKDIKIQYKNDLPIFDYSILNKNEQSFSFKDLATKLGVRHMHHENSFIEFNREPLIPHMVSREGPAIAVGDVNNDGLEDFFVGSCKFDTSSIYIQTNTGTFIHSKQTVFFDDNNYEDVDAQFSDLNNDGYIDLIVASGGNEYSGKSLMLKPRIYFNDRKGNFLKSPGTISNDILLTASSVTILDANEDGHPDIFFGARAQPREYGIKPKSYLLLNNGKGDFSIDNRNSDIISEVGLITSSIDCDINKDGKSDLLISTEWNGVYWFKNTTQGFVKETITPDKGWWNTAVPIDLDNDGDLDMIVGNLGLNNKFNVSEKTPLTMYFDDFDDNGTKEQILTYYLNGKEILFNNHEEVLKQLPGLKKKYLHAADFASASVNDIFGNKLKKAIKLQATNFSNMIFENTGKGGFVKRSIPWELQLAPVKSILPIKYNEDKFPDILLAGNFYHNNIQMGRYDAGFGSILLNKGNFNFELVNLNNESLSGEIRELKSISIQKETYIIAGKNDDYLSMLKLKK